MSDLPGDPFVVHRNETETVHIHMVQSAEVRKMDLELPGEQPLWVERTTLPEGPTRPMLVLIHGFAQNRPRGTPLFARCLHGWRVRGWDVGTGTARSRRSRRRGGGSPPHFRLPRRSSS